MMPFKNTVDKLLFFIETVAVLPCLYFWIINDFDNKIYVYCIKIVIICVLVRLLILVYKKLSHHK